MAKIKLDIYNLTVVALIVYLKAIRDKITAVEKDKLKMDAAAAHQELDSIIEKNRQQQAPARAARGLRARIPIAPTSKTPSDAGSGTSTGP